MNFSKDKIHSEAQNIEPQNVLHEHEADYEKAERDLLKDALRRTHTERFLVATRLYKIQQMLGKAKIIHQP